jgi:cobalt-zinc-cadmium efflux system membrane fusion protein
MITQDKRLTAGIAGAMLLAAIGGFSVARCTAGSPTNSETGEKQHPPSDSLILSTEAIKSAGIATEPVRAGGLGAEIVAQATVTAAPSGEAIVTARAGGAVTRVLKRLGDSVRPGEALAVVESRDAAQIAADRSAAGARAVLAQRNLARERYLYDQRVSARVDYERAQADAAAAAAEARRAQVAAGAANVTRDGRGVIVASPIAGRVTSENVSLGAFVQPETELFRVADPRQIQVEAAVGPGDAERLSPGDRAIVELVDGRTVEGRVRSVTPTLSGDTRSATALLDVPGGVLQPGLGVRARLMPSRTAHSAGISVAEDAVQSVDGRDAVFTRTAKGFRARFVTLGQRSAGRVEIVAGLKPGEIIATRNAFLLKAELGKSAGEEE